ncbi:MAG: DUF971 family protein [Planctomycetota bacterium]|jgi:DUF971 family protein
MSYGEKNTPTGLSKPDGDHVAIKWADGVETTIPMNYLRAKCPCASCVEEWTGALMVKPEDVAHVRVDTMKQVGNYAFSIVFTDAHATGIFTYRRLRAWGDEFLGKAAE